MLFEAGYEGSFDVVSIGQFRQCFGFVEVYKILIKCLVFDGIGGICPKDSLEGRLEVLLNYELAYLMRPELFIKPQLSIRTSGVQNS